MSTYQNAGGVFASIAIVAAALFFLANAMAALVSHQIGGLSVVFSVEAALAAGLFLPAILRRLGDHETLSVYREMTAQH